MEPIAQNVRMRGWVLVGLPECSCWRHCCMSWGMARTSIPARLCFDLRSFFFFWLCCMCACVRACARVPAPSLSMFLFSSLLFSWWSCGWCCPVPAVRKENRKCNYCSWSTADIWPWCRAFIYYSGESVMILTDSRHYVQWAVVDLSVHSGAMPCLAIAVVSCDNWIIQARSVAQE